MQRQYDESRLHRKSASNRKRLCTISPPKTVQMLTLIYILSSKTLGISFCSLNGTNQLWLVHCSGINAHIFCDVSDFLNVHVSLPFLPLFIILSLKRARERMLLCGEEILRNGGEGEIRTHGRVAPTTIFKTVAFNRSATSPIQTSTIPCRYRYSDITLVCWHQNSCRTLRYKLTQQAFCFLSS